MPVGEPEVPIEAPAKVPKEAPAGTLGVGGDVAAIRGSARHDVSTALRVWGTYSPQPWSLTGELALVPHTDRTGMYAFRTLAFDASVLVEAMAAPHATAFHAGIGPALVVRTTRFTSDDVAGSTVLPELGARARVALDGPLGSTLAWSWHLGTTIHPSGTDWDAGLGLGIAL